MTHRKRWLITTGALMGFIAALLFGGASSMASTGTAATAAEPPSIGQTFFADSGDRCPMGFTKGTLDWSVGPTQAVAVRGGVVDRPVSGEILPACGEDRRFTAATFTAYSRTSPPTTTTVRVNNGTQNFAFLLGGPGPVVLVVIQVCRHSLLTGQVDYCGDPKKYTPIFTPA